MKPQPFLERDLGGNWQVIYPEIINKFRDDYWNAIEILESNPKKSEKELKKIIFVCGNGHMDAILHLGYLMNETARPIEGNALIFKAHTIALEALPKDFDPTKEQIYWGDIPNRTLLRTFHAIGLEYINEQQYEKAIDKFNFIINVNSGDHQGVRFLLPECLLALEKYSDFLTLDAKLNESTSFEFSYAKILAYFKINQLDKARIMLKNAIEKHQFIAQELIKEKHSFPFAEFDPPLLGIPRGSRQEAFEYWNRTKHLWFKNKDVIQFIAANM